MGSSLLSTLENSINNSYVLLFLEKEFHSFLPENCHQSYRKFRHQNYRKKKPKLISFLIIWISNLIFKFQVFTKSTQMTTEQDTFETVKFMIGTTMLPFYICKILVKNSRPCNTKQKLVSFANFLTLKQSEIVINLKHFGF